MTLIAFRVHPDHVDIITDGLSYMEMGQRLGRTSKVSLLPHLDAAVVTQGSSFFGNVWAFELARLTTFVDSFDDLDALAEDNLTDALESIDLPGEWADPLVLHLGYSPSAGRFKAFAYSASNGFESVELTDSLHVMPAPTSLKTTPVLAGAGGAELVIAEGVDPCTPEEWAALARRAHADRSLLPPTTGDKVIIGDAVTYTRLERGAVTQRVIHRFDDDEQLRRMLTGTLHPIGQLGPCVCGKDKAMARCHGKASVRCPCGSGESFGDCCRFDPDGEEARDLLRRHPQLRKYQRVDTAAPEPAPHEPTAAVGRNEPCPCGSGVKHKKCCLLAAAS